MSPLLGSIEVNRSVEVRKEQGDHVEPNPEYEGSYESQGYDYVDELNHNVRGEVVNLKGHKRVVRVPH